MNEWFRSTGLGRALAEVLIAKGERVFATARKPEELSDLVASLALPVKAGPAEPRPGHPRWDTDRDP